MMSLICWKKMLYTPNGYEFNLSSDKYIIRRHNIQQHCILTHSHYQMTLMEWLVTNRKNWCKTYQAWKVLRPNEEARKVIQGILDDVFQLYSKGSFHGFLDDPENILLHVKEALLGGDPKMIKPVSFR